MSGRVFVANTSFSVEFEGRPLVVEGGRTIREGHPLMEAFPHFFTEIVPDFEHVPPAARPQPAPQPKRVAPQPAPKRQAAEGG